MKLLLFLSEITIPLLIFCIVGYGLLNRQPVYEEFVEGAKDGFWTVIKIMPTLIGLMVAVGVLRASGLLDCIAQGLGQITAEIGFPAELFPVTIVKMFSSSAATGLLLDIYKEYRFHAWKNGICYDEQHRNHFLYNVSLFHVGKSKENPLYACGCIAGNSGRYDRKCGDRFLYVTMSVELKKAAYAGNVSGKFDNYAE